MSIKTCVIGLGGIGQGVHLPGIKNCDDFSLEAICDIDEEKLAKVGEQYGVPTARRYTDYKLMLKDTALDAVEICTPNDLHFCMAMDAIKAGKHVALEKPVTLDARQAEALALAARQAKVKTMVCFSYRFKAAARYARALIKQGRIGRLYHADMVYDQDWGLPAFHTPFVWRFSAARSGSGALGDLGSHALDLIRFVTGQSYLSLIGHAGTRVSARKSLSGEGEERVDVDDFINFNAEMSEGLAATFRISRLAFGRGNYQQLELYGERGALIYTLDADGQGRDTLAICEERDGKVPREFLPLPIPEEYFADQTRAFADLILEKGAPETPTFEDGLYNQHLVDDLLLSVREKRWVEVD